MDQLYSDIALVEAYDALNSSRHDLEFYAKELPDAPASILDIGCGTGTFAIELARRGYAVTGVDPSPQMIGAAQKKDVDGHVNWIAGPVPSIPAGLRFDGAVMTGHAFQCLLTDDDVTTLFNAVRERLKPQTSFWFETRNPATQPWQRWTPEHSAPPTALGDNRFVRVVHNVLEIRKGFVTFEERYEFSDRAGALRSESTLRFLELDEIGRLATKSAFVVKEAFGDWSKGPWREDSPEIIVRLARADR